jgi:outer membrane protein assembly factor BamB
MFSPKKTPLFSILIFFTGMMLTLSISSCKDDDEQPSISEYDPSVHVYATNFRSRVGEWETFIDITTGNYDSIPGTKEPAGAINFPNGTAALTDFPQNRRIYINQADGQEMIIQNLTTLEKTTIPLELPDGSSLITRPEFLAFGADNNTVYAFDIADNAIYVVNLTTQTLSIHADNLPLNGSSFEAMIYQKSTNDLLFLEREKYYIFDLDANELVNDSGVLPGLFGFVQHPDNDFVYALTYPNADRVFRLVRLARTDNEFTTQTLSGSDLAIDDLSPNLQTIHTATNAFVCRGGTTLENNIETYIYSIDLTTGELLRTVTLNGFELMTKLEGE